MVIRSINIIGITGGIGHAFFDIIKNSDMKIGGIYHKNDRLAKMIKKKHPNVILHRVDYSKEWGIGNNHIPAYEGLLYAIGKPHFIKGILNFDDIDLFEQINLNITSLHLLINQLCSKEKSPLKKVVVIASLCPKRIDSLYHLVKHLQIEYLRKIKPTLNEMGIGLSVINTGWVNTNMYKQYINATGTHIDNILSPIDVAKCCFREFKKNQLYSLVDML